MQLKITGDSKTLYALQEHLAKSKAKLDYSPLFNRRVGYSGEPVLTAIIIALGGPVIIKEITGLIKHWMTLKHEEKMLIDKISIELLKEGFAAKKVGPQETIALLEEYIANEVISSDRPGV